MTELYCQSEQNAIHNLYSDSFRHILLVSTAMTWHDIKLNEYESMINQNTYRFLLQTS